jgi:hypothetical protein
VGTVMRFAPWLGIEVATQVATRVPTEMATEVNRV